LTLTLTLTFMESVGAYNLQSRDMTAWSYCLMFYAVLGNDRCGSSGSIVSDYGLDDRGSIPDGQRIFLLAPASRPALGPHPASCPMGTGGPFPGGKARPGRDADHSPSSSAEVKYELELYLLSPPCASMACSGTALLLLFFMLS
jgi:hypothetical protein